MPHTAEKPPIQFYELPDFAANSHKSKSNGRAVIIPEALTDIEGNQVDLTREGGAFLVGAGATSMLVTVRAAQWRNAEGDPTVRTSDAMIVHGYNTADSILDGPTRVAHEIEGFVIDEQTSEPIATAEEGDAHPELFLDCREEATTPTDNLAEAAIHVYDAFNSLWGIAQNAGGLLYAGSNLAHRTRNMEDINTHPYVQRIIRLLGERNQYLSNSESFLWLDGGSSQTHVERAFTHEAGAFAANTHSIILSPLTLALTAASPYSRGELSPRFAGNYAGLKSDVGYMATRFFGRMVGSPEAGPLQQLIPASKGDLAALTNQRMKHGEISNPGRIGNQHGDIRYRTDLAPNGTHELCAKDNAGGHIQTIMSISAFERSFMFVLENAYASGRIEELAKQYPSVVSTKIYEQEEELLAAALSNDEQAAIVGMNAYITDMRGQKVPAKKALTQVLTMVHEETARPGYEPYRLDKAVYDWIVKRVKEPHYKAMLLNQDATKPGATLERYYAGEPGTFAQYLRTRVAQLCLRGGYKPQDAIAQAQIEAAESHQKYLRRVHPERDFAFLAV